MSNLLDITLADKLALLGASLVLRVDDMNAILAWHDTGTYNGRAFDKYRIGVWYWSTRHQAWQQGQGSLSVAYERNLELLQGLHDLALSQLAVLNEPIKTKPAKRKATA